MVETETLADKPTCGIVMPLSLIEDCSPIHWTEVRQIIDESIDDAGFRSNLVSDADDVGVIQKRIIQNLYDNPIVVCDVSCKNPNVMFELGLRLAFDKPTIIIKDDKTGYSFDTAPIEHLTYPRDLRFSQIIEFKKSLTAKIKSTNHKAENDPDYTPFLKHFGQFKVAKLDEKAVSFDELILEQLQNLSSQVRRLQSDRRIMRVPSPTPPSSQTTASRNDPGAIRLTFQSDSKAAIDTYLSTSSKASALVQDVFWLDDQAAVLEFKDGHDLSNRYVLRELARYIIEAEPLTFVAKTVFDKDFLEKVRMFD